MSHKDDLPMTPEFIALCESGAVFMRDPSKPLRFTVVEPECRYPCGCDRFPEEHCSCMEGHEAHPVTLTDFLLARIAEDESWARWASSKTPRFPGDTQARFHPRRLLAECEAKRRIVGRHSGIGDTGCLRCVCDDTSHDLRNQPCATIRLLALPYADHPDCREEWRP